VRPGEELPAAPLAAWLHASALTIEQFPGGHSNLTYLLRFRDEQGERELVLRRPPAGSAVRTAHDMGREVRVLSGLAGHYSRVPRVAAACDDPSVIGAPFYLMERVPGVILRQARLPDGGALPPARLRALSEGLVDALVELHAVDPRAAGLGGLGRPAGYTARQVSGWTERWQQAATAEVPDIAAAAAWLAGHLPRRDAAAEERGAVLLHNDFKYDNLVLTSDLAGIAAVLDWEMATTGEPLMDLGTSLAYWLDPDDQEAQVRLPAGPTALPGNLSRAEVVERYARTSGRDVAEILFYYVFGLLKIAVIAQQIHFRYQRGLTRDERFAGLGGAVRLLGRTAAQAIARQRIDRLWD
jgi:aminoglycoside phosphotransferase (APT) family kinase protein